MRTRWAWIAATIVVSIVLVQFASVFHHPDNRSLRLNDEANLLVYDRAAGDELERIFAVDLQQSREITKAAYAARPWQQQLLEYAAKLIAPLL